MGIEQFNHRGVERSEPGSRWRTWTQRRITAQQPLLQYPFVFVQQRDGDRPGVGIAPVYRRAPDAGRLGDVVHRDRARVASGEKIGRRGQHAGPVARCVRPLGYPR